MHVVIAIVTMVMVNKHISDFDTRTSESEVNLALIEVRFC